MGNRFGIHGLEAASAHSERDVGTGRISSRPTEVPKSESRSDFGSSCPDPEVSQTKSAPCHNGAQNVGQETNALRRPEDVRRKDDYGWSPYVALPCATMAPNCGAEEAKMEAFSVAPKIFGRKNWLSLQRIRTSCCLHPNLNE